MRRDVPAATVYSAALLVLSLLWSGTARAEESPEARWFDVHFQATVATQAHPGFSAAYSGPHSLSPDGESATSVVMDLFSAARLWGGAELYFNPLLSGGRGLSSTLGVAAFPSGEVYRVGDPQPTIFLGRVFLRQVLGLGGGRVHLDAAPTQIAVERDRDALTLTIGRFSTTDVVDANPVSNDPHTRFMSWALWASAAFDYPADTRGYTWGAAAALDLGGWSGRASIFLEPSVANGTDFEWDITKARGIVVEGERRWSWNGRGGAVRALGFLNTAHMGIYDEALASSSPPDVTATRQDGRQKYGFAVSANQDFTGGLSAFVRASWNDGKTESWAFTEIERSVALGAVQSGVLWGRESDEAGVAVVISGLGNQHRRYFEAGGLGFMLGDGALRYGPEILGELYYRFAVTKEISVGGNYQPIVNPAFNRDRGPVHVFTGRVHVSF
ncbi:MAG TPA: carbohydrate porin [Myxococcales bacterium]|jgi:high affinity Mn2+ porin|nr:carbohydrate porin [Myxococcales bacterium]